MMELENLVLAYNLQFFAKDGPGGEKTEPATSKKLDDVRKEGQVAKSKELISAVSLLALFVLIKVYIGIVGEKLLKVFQDFYNTFDKIISSSATGFPMNLSLEAVKQMLISIVLIAAPFLIVAVKNVFMDVLNITLPIFLIAVVIAILGNVLQQKWMVTAKPLQPKASKISPLSGFKRIFSVKQLVELLKAIAMMAVIGIVAYQTIKDKLPLILTFYNIPLYTAIAAVGNILVDMGIRVSAVFLIIGFADLIFQRHKFKTDNMMTKQEVKDEFKNSEGDPQVKGQVKRRMMEISRRRMMEALPEADVVITNPTHFAVALKYEPNSGKAPVVIAKGADYLAFQIKDKAKEYHIEIVENKPLARILYHNVDIGMEIPPELYQVVAEILARVLQPGKQKTMLL